MTTTRIVVKKGARKLLVYKDGRVVFRTSIAHGGPRTLLGIRQIVKWSPGPVSPNRNYNPYTWFSFGRTFDPKYHWPAVGSSGHVRPGRGMYPAKRLSNTEGEVFYNGRWQAVWKDSNPFGALMATLARGSRPGSIHIHGTARDRAGRDTLPTMEGESFTKGCVRATNPAIRRIRQLSPVGTEVSIEP
jgi:lipoprotein-anchoring transpeptidase ErfK/SrfK